LEVVHINQRNRIIVAAIAITTIVVLLAFLTISSDGSTAVALTWAQLRNTTYPSELPRSKVAPLQDGVYEEEIVPGAATRLKIQLADIAGFGQIDGNGTIDAAVVLIGSPGGSGTFIYLTAVLNEGGSPTPAATVLLGDRVAVRAVQIEGRKITVQMRVRGPSDPLAALTREVTRVYTLQDGQLNLESEETADVPSMRPDQFAFQPQQLGIETGKSVTQKGVLKPGELATFLIRGDAGQELRVTANAQFNNAVLSIQGVEDLTQLVSRTNYVHTWSGALPSSQTYAVTLITLAGNDLKYELRVALKAAPTPIPTPTLRPAPTATLRPAPTTTRGPGGSAPPVPAPLKGAFRPAQVQLSLAFDAASRFLDGRAPSWGVAVASPATATLYAQNGDAQFELASTVKVLIALAVLDAAQREGRYVDSFELSLLWPMITISDNDSATKLWDQLGGGRGLANYVASVGEAGIKPYDGPFWGTSTASPSSLAKVLARAVFGDLLDSNHRMLFLNLLEKVTPSQRWGITAGLEGEGGVTARIGLKDGWYPAEAGWRVNSVGFVVGTDGQRFYTMAVLTNGQPSWQYGIATIEGVALQVNSTLLDAMQPLIRP
jgi:hypothetical protein